MILNESHENNDLTNSASSDHDVSDASINKKFMGLKVWDNHSKDVTDVFINNPTQIYKNGFVENTTTKEYLSFDYDITKLCGSDIPNFLQLKDACKATMSFYFNDHQVRPTEEQIIFTGQIIYKILDLDINKDTEFDVKIEMTFCGESWFDYIDHDKYNNTKTIVLKQISDHLAQAIKRVRANRESMFFQNQTNQKFPGFEVSDVNVDDLTSTFITNPQKVYNDNLKKETDAFWISYRMDQLQDSNICKFPKLSHNHHGTIHFCFLGPGKATKKQIGLTKEIIKQILSMDINKDQNVKISIDVYAIDFDGDCNVIGSIAAQQSKYEEKKTKVLSGINEYFDKKIKDFSGPEEQNEHKDNKGNSDIETPTKATLITSNWMYVIGFVLFVCIIYFLVK